MTTQLDRITEKNAALILIDHNLGTSLAVESASRQALVNNVVALAEIGKLFQLPIVVTNGEDTDTSGLLFPELTAVLGDVPVIKRSGTLNSWDDEAFRAAVEATGRRNLIMAGLFTEVCLLFPALSALAEGYEVYPVVDASAGETQVSQEAALQRMIRAGARPTTWFSLGAELQESWANQATAAEFAEISGRHFAEFGWPYAPGFREPRETLPSTRCEIASAIHSPPYRTGWLTGTNNLLGFGRIGRRVAELARVIGYTVITFVPAPMALDNPS